MAVDTHVVPKMSEQDILAQPPEVWVAVEQAILRGGWSGRVKQMLQYEGANGGRWIEGAPPPFWLTWERAKQLEALDVPIRQLFWAYALLMHARA